jgi:nucleoside-diphosphate-sugar epimerase
MSSRASPKSVTSWDSADGHRVVGVDNLNNGYDLHLKQWRLAQLEGRPGFTFHRLDITDRSTLERSTFNVSTP